jgi:hypothetical protein
MSTTITDLPLETNNLTDNDYMLVDVFNGSTYDSKKIIKSTILGYKSLSVIITQRDTDAPTIVTLQDDFGVEYILSYEGAGTYKITASENIFETDKVFPVFGVPNIDGTPNKVVSYRYFTQSTNELYLFSYSGDELDNNCMYQTPLEIRVYNRVF